jgi:hypothetical protein
MRMGKIAYHNVIHYDTLIVWDRRRVGFRCLLDFTAPQLKTVRPASPKGS